jgi:D-3-phosphoglycerate dehydrogenase
MEEAGVEYVINPLGKKLTEDDLCSLICGFDAVIAGTELITKRVLEKTKTLKLISRVGIGLDNVDLLEARKRGIEVCYTPDAPSPAVAELTITLMLSLLRQVHVSNSQIHAGIWHRFFGRRLSECAVGIIGTGRIGKRVIRHLDGFDVKRVLANDLHTKHSFAGVTSVEWCEKETIYREADIVSIHVPLTKDTQHMIGRSQLEMMKDDALLINTARGGIINEQELFNVIQSGHLAGVALDVFEEEPYTGNFQELDKCLLTSHMGSMSIDCRTRMEVEATEEAVGYLAGNPLRRRVPETEYQLREQQR